jgi:hypothetical protein
VKSIVYALVLTMCIGFAGASAAAQKAVPQKAGVQKATEKADSRKTGTQKGALWAVSDGKGAVSLFWVPAGMVWPAGGWRLERIEGKKVVVLAERIGPGTDQAALSRLPEEKSTSIATFKSKIAEKALPKEERDLAMMIMGLTAAQDIDFGLALGLRFQDVQAGTGVRSYRLTALTGQSKPGPVLNSQVVDPGVATPLTESPGGLQAKVHEHGVELTWNNPPESETMPVLAFQVEREVESSGTLLLTNKPLLISKLDGKAVGTFTDVTPPKECKATYRVSSLDMFGRTGKAAGLTLFIPDLSAKVPPSGINAEAGENAVLVTWESNPSPFTTGYLVERSMLRSGPYETLTPKGLDAQTLRYEDKPLRGGSTFFYRIRSVDARGETGPPSLFVAATPKNRQAPPTPDGVKVEVGRTRVRLTWNPVAFPVAGYLIERKAKDGQRWELLTHETVPQPQYDDHFGLHATGEPSYRVIAVAYDTQQSKPSREVKAVLPDTLSPNPPTITDADGRDGKVVLRFRATAPVDDVEQFLVVRSVSEDDPGLVIGDPIPRKKDRFEDTFVTVGRKYIYRMVAVDRSGNRSELSRSVHVVVKNPPIPMPKKPVLSITTEPLRAVGISFVLPPDGFEVIVQRLDPERGWLALTGGIRNATQAMDLKPPAVGPAQYRVLYRAANGVIGEPSEPVEILLQ